MLRREDCKPGTLVECIDASGNFQLGVADSNLKAGAIYTVVGAIVGLHDWGVLVEEAHVPLPGNAYYPSRFRLLPDSRLEVFRALLAPIRTKDPTHA